MKLYLKGKRFGRLLAESYDPVSYKWNCVCDCGKIVKVKGTHLNSGDTASCGCLRKDLTSLKNTTHGMTHKKEYDIWCGVIKRCTDIKSSNYSRYGGAGITVSEEWKSFEQFFHDMGPMPSKKHSIDRINNEAGYCRENCRWATGTEQMNNRSNAVLVTYKGETINYAEAARRSGISRSTLQSRIRRGLTGDKLFETYAIKEPI